MDILSEKLKILFEQQDNIDDKEKSDENVDKNISDTEEPKLPDENIDNEESIESTEDIGGIEGASAHQLGRTFEIKHLYHRMLSIRNHLEIFVEEEFDDIKAYLSKGIELFELVIDNYAKYEDKIDDIILLYYEFIKNIYEVTKKKYKAYSKNK